MSSDRPMEWLRISPARKLDQQRLQAFVLALANSPALGTVVFDLTVSTKGEPVYRLGSHNRAAIRALLLSFVPGTRAVECGRPATPLDVRPRCSWFAQTSTALWPLNADAGTDFSRRLLTVLERSARPSRTITHRVTIRSRQPAMHVSSVLAERPAETWGQLLRRAALGPRAIDSAQRRELVGKRALAGADVSIELIEHERAAPVDDAPLAVGSSRATSPKPRDLRVAMPLSGYLAALRALEAPGVRFRLRSSRSLIALLPSKRNVRLNGAEITASLGWPLGDQDYPGLDRSQPVVLPYVGKPSAKRLVGTALEPARRPVSLNRQDSLRHLHVLGPSGVGKSTLLLNLALSDIATGTGSVICDPKGDLIDDILRTVPKAHTNQLVLLDPSRADYSVGFNPLAVPRDQAELAVDGIVHTFASIYADNWGPRTSDILHSSCLTLVGTPWASLAHLPRLLGDEGFRTQVLASAQISSPLRGFWSWYNGISEAERFAATAPLMNKLRPFLLRSGVRSMLAQTDSTFDPKDIFEQNLTLLAPLRTGRLGPAAAQLLGSFVLARIWLEIQAQAKRPAHARRPVSLILDEFQDYLRFSSDLPSALAQARGLGVGISLAHQHLGQLNRSVRDAVTANTASKIYFRLGDDDATSLARAIPDLEQRDLAGLPSYETYSRLLQDNELLPWARLRTPEPPRNRRSSSEQLARELAQKWGTPPEQIDARLEACQPRARDTTESAAGFEQIGRRKGGQT